MLSAVPFTTLLALAAASTVGALVPADQHVLAPTEDGVRQTGLEEIVYELKKAEIIPTVLDDFIPKLNITLYWPDSKVGTALGNTLKPKDLQHAPDLYAWFPDDEPSGLPNMSYTLALTDPDAPSRDNPEWSEFCHGIITGFRPQYPTASVIHSAPSAQTVRGKHAYKAGFHLAEVKELVPYKPPGPPKKTGKHRYVFVLLAPANGTSDELNLTKPKVRKHWGFGKERHGVRDWAEENGLAVLGANFIYAQHKKQ